MRSNTLKFFVFVILFLIFIFCFESLLRFQEKDHFGEMDLDSCVAERPPSGTRERPLGDTVILDRPLHPSLNGDRREAAAVELDQDPMCFEDVAVRFTDEEWALLYPDQRALHKDVMEENCGIVASLAFGWPKRRLILEMEGMP
nr:putative zinc finger protein 705E [Zootoca vivipara]